MRSEHSQCVVAKSALQTFVISVVREGVSVTRFTLRESLFADMTLVPTTFLLMCLLVFLPGGLFRPSKNALFTLVGVPFVRLANLQFLPVLQQFFVVKCFLVIFYFL